LKRSKKNHAVIERIRNEAGEAVFTATEAKNHLRLLNQRRHIFALERCDFHDRPELTITKETVRAGKIEYVTRNFSKLSLGQQQAILLSIMLFSKANVPLIIDQPEDNLDSEFIYKTFVKTLRVVKEKRQVMMVTHNANIAV
jgi:ABC-type Mn2+/Zn2+ transport system ATPase subunit